MKLPPNWTESDVRSALAVNQKNLEDRRAYLTKQMREGAKELDAIDSQLDAIAQSVRALNHK